MKTQKEYLEDPNGCPKCDTVIMDDEDSFLSDIISQREDLGEIIEVSHICANCFLPFSDIYQLVKFEIDEE